MEVKEYVDVVDGIDLSTTTTAVGYKFIFRRADR
jgi:hypothetical protein